MGLPKHTRRIYTCHETLGDKNTHCWGRGRLFLSTQRRRKPPQLEASSLLRSASTCAESSSWSRPKVVMRISWSPMGQGKSDEHPSYEESTV
ncbi:hypothetical protein Taro_046088 [Colocasia esculenta]|uniref:Uncharacterized protein n=1 Tax=Colocasia esculenta TaxID=4460 RepID=A0A843X554_COLES|nr:hypothetical protein [Colocasia esculenta]